MRLDRGSRELRSIVKYHVVTQANGVLGRILIRLPALGQGAVLLAFGIEHREAVLDMDCGLGKVAMGRERIEATRFLRNREADDAAGLWFSLGRGKRADQRKRAASHTNQE